MADQIPDTGLLAIRDHGDVVILAACLQELRSISGTSGGTSGETLQPYNATSATITNVAAGPSVIVFKDASGNTIKTRTYTYTNGGASSSDVLTGWADT